MNSWQIVSAIALFVLLGGCGGRSVDLDHHVDLGGGGQPASESEPIDHTPRTILPESVYLFWVDDTRLYWIVFGEPTLRSCLKNDCATTTTSYGSVWGYGVAIGRNDVFWGPIDSPTSIVTCPKTGCVSAPRLLFQDPSYVAIRVIAADADYFYWSSAFDIYRCPSAGCAATPEVVAADETTDSDFGFQGDSVFWRETTVDEHGGTLSAVVRAAPKDGSRPPRTVLGPNEAPRLEPGFALDATRIYWVDDTERVMTCPLQGCGGVPPTVLVTGDLRKSSLQVDGSGLFWLEASPTDGFNSQALHYCAFADGASQLSSTVLEGPIPAYTMDDRYLYWGKRSADSGYPTSIRRSPKPGL